MATRTQKAAMKKKAEAAKAGTPKAPAKRAKAPKAKAAVAWEEPQEQLPEPKRTSFAERFWHRLGARAQKKEAEAHRHEAEVEAYEAAQEKQAARQAAAERKAHEAAERKKAARSARELARIAKEEERHVAEDAERAKEDAKRERAEKAKAARAAKADAAREAAEARLRKAQERREAKAREQAEAERAAAAEAERAEREARKAEQQAAAEAERQARAERKEQERAERLAEKQARADRKAQEKAERAAASEAAREAKAAARRRPEPEPEEGEAVAIDEEPEEGEAVAIDDEPEPEPEPESEPEPAPVVQVRSRRPEPAAAEDDDEDEEDEPAPAPKAKARDVPPPTSDLDRHADKLAAELAARRSKPVTIDVEDEPVPTLPVGRATRTAPDTPKEQLVLDPAPPARINEPPAPKGLSIPEHYLLLALEDGWDERTEKNKPGALGAGLTGALLLELVLQGAVKVQRDRFVLENADLDDATEAVAKKLEQFNDRPSLQAMAQLAKWLPQLLPAYKDRLAGRGLIAHKAWRHLGLAYRSQTALLDPDAQERLRNKLARAIAGGGRPDAPTILSLGLLEASGLFGLVVPPGAQAYNRKRLNGLLGGKDVMGYKVDDQLKGIQEIAVRTILDNVRLMTTKG